MRQPLLPLVGLSLAEWFHRAARLGAVSFGAALRRCGPSPHRRGVGALVGLLVACAIVVAIKAWRVGLEVAPFVTDNVAALPPTEVGLVLGCASKLADGRKNLFFEHRMDAAAELFRRQKVQFLLVSGDNSRLDYDEPSDMRRSLVERGVPAERIVLDHAGFRTLDSVMRARDVFGLRRFIVVSQRFHNERAVYLARAHEVEAYGYDAPDVGGPEGLRMHGREIASRVRAVLDLALGASPKFSGPSEGARFAATPSMSRDP